MKYLLIVAIPLFLGACSAQNQQVRVVYSPAEVKTYHFEMNPGDVLVCDKNGCRTIQP